MPVRARKIVVDNLELGTSSDDDCGPPRKFDNDKMKVKFSARQRKRLAIFSLKVLLCAACFAYVIVPIAIILFPQIERSMIFLTFVGWPWFVDFEQPQAVGLSNTRHFFVESENNIQLGTWHILPKSLVGSADNSNTFYELSLRKGLPVILYMHGNSGSRAGLHRVELYKVLRDLDAHVVAFDYRGYADSTSVSPSEDGVVKDGKAVYHWLKKRTGTSPLFVWGHSLGTGVATRAVSELCQEGEPPFGLILESPFNNMQDEIREHWMAKIFNAAPWFQWAVAHALKENKLLFESDKQPYTTSREASVIRSGSEIYSWTDGIVTHNNIFFRHHGSLFLPELNLNYLSLNDLLRIISGITSPIVVFHAMDDNIIPVQLAERLYNAAVDGRPKSAAPVSLVVLGGEHGYGHRYICRAPELTDTLRKFLTHPEEKL